jgi:hypothetical protein
VAPNGLAADPPAARGQIRISILTNPFIYIETPTGAGGTERQVCASVSSAFPGRAALSFIDESSKKVYYLTSQIERGQGEF